ncbi:hypothetical protein CONPUDRAFT_68470, partial [Coniophora puteana RWD-64-598 SS2]
SADRPGMALLTGLVGHHGKFSCHLYCGVIGQHIPDTSHYYPVLQRPTKPAIYSKAGCDHNTIDINHLPSPGAGEYWGNLTHVLASCTQQEFAARQQETGIRKLGIFMGMPQSLPPPFGWGCDIMHLTAINVRDLLIPLWQGTHSTKDDDHPSCWGWAALADSDTW